MAETNMAHCEIVCTNFVRYLCLGVRVLRRCVPLRLFFFKIFGKLSLLNGDAHYLFDERSTSKQYEHVTFEVARFDSAAV